MQRGIFALQFVLEGKIHRVRLTGLSMTKRRLRFPRIVVAVVKKENDRATDFRLEFSQNDSPVPILLVDVDSKACQITERITAVAGTGCDQVFL